MERAFVVKTAHSGGEPVAGVYDELKAGRARIGWSSQDNQNLRKICDKKPENDDEREARKCLGFLTKVEIGDRFVYPHQPRRRMMSVVEITGDYGYDDGIEIIGGDFRSFRPCKMETPEPVHMYDEIVPSKLRHRLGCPGRFSEIGDTAPLTDFLKHVSQAGQLRDDTNRAAVGRIHEKLRKMLPKEIHREFARADLSRRLCKELFERMGYTATNVQEGPAEAGADLCVTVGSPLLPDERDVVVGVQVFSYEDDVRKGSIEGKLNQLLEGWEKNSLDSGVLLTTGNPDRPAEEFVEQHNRDRHDRPVKLIGGEELADLFLQYVLPESS